MMLIAKNVILTFFVGIFGSEKVLKVQQFFSHLMQSTGGGCVSLSFSKIFY